MFQIKNLSFSYGKNEVFENLSAEFGKNSIVGILGSNGAGKSTLIECLEGIKSPQKGKIFFNDIKIDKKFRDMISIQFQEASFFYKLKVAEIFDIAKGLLNYTDDIRFLQSEFELLDHIQKYYEQLSGGMKQKVAVALAIMNEDSKVIFLDEPTSGLDVFSRKKLWRSIRKLKQKGKTVVLTTHLIDEAEALCDEVIILDKGRIIEQGSPDALSRKYCDRLEYNVGLSRELDGRDFIEQNPFVVNVLQPDPHGYRYKIFCNGELSNGEMIYRMISFFRDQGYETDEFSLNKYNLETAFFNIIGYRLDESGDAVV